MLQSWELTIKSAHLLKELHLLRYRKPSAFEIQFYIFMLEQFCQIWLVTIFHTNFIFFLFFSCYSVFFFHRPKGKLNQHPRGLKNKTSTDSVLKYNLRYLSFSLRFIILTCVLGYSHKPYKKSFFFLLLL